MNFGVDLKQYNKELIQFCKSKREEKIIKSEETIRDIKRK